jgi:hypothetical protein
MKCYLYDYSVRILNFKMSVSSLTADFRIHLFIVFFRIELSPKTCPSAMDFKLRITV